MARKRKPSGRGYRSRSTNFREPLQRFLIVCEGEKTEPAYFNSFRVPTVAIRVVGLGKDPLTLMQWAEQLRAKDDYDQVWSVFDRDDILPERFNQALALAKQLGISVAYSNQAFELWYLLHFHYVNTALTRGDYTQKLSEELGRPYRKDDDGLYQELLSQQTTAVQHATNLLTQYKPPNPPYDDPSTTVHLLVAELNRFLPQNRFQ